MLGKTAGALFPNPGNAATKTADFARFRRLKTAKTGILVLQSGHFADSRRHGGQGFEHREEIPGAFIGQAAERNVAPARPRGRYAPSPTGELHLGNASSALLAWLSIRARGGSFVMRMEDLDRVTSSVDHERAQLDEPLYLEVFGAPPPAARKRA